MKTHIDLFTGIGGFTIAANMVGFKTIVMCEIDPFCQAVLKKRFPDIPLIDDIRKMNGRDYRGATLLTGGFPCQPFSVAGNRKGDKDDRYLWPEMFRIIKEAKPSWVLGENVAGIVNMVLDKTLSDLESEGYETGTLIIPSCAVNAPHRRDRVWIIAHKQCLGWEKRASKRIQSSEQEAEGQNINNFNTESHDSDATKQGLEGEMWEKQSRDFGRFATYYTRQSQIWNINWTEVATRLCRVDDGLPTRMDGLELSKARHRMERIKALGNAIVPQVATKIIEIIYKIEEEIL